LRFAHRLSLAEYRLRGEFEPSGGRLAQSGLGRKAARGVYARALTA
jgi:hypothetical protein